jgi:type II secretory pathway pseudopilin PulG
MKSLFRLLLKTQLKRNGSQSDKINSGMTMLELLVGTIMAFLIITPMLTFVVDMLNTDRREQVKANTEQDIQSAASFMAQDLSQAVRIYNQSEINDEIVKKSRPAILVPSGSTPILVFWKRQLVKDAIPAVATVNCNSNPEQCDDTNVMSLVTYYVRQDNNSTWCADGSPCPARIERLEIRDGVKDPTDPTKYLCDTTPSLCPQANDPKKRDSGFNPAFEIKDATKLVGSTTDTINKDPEVLVNYLDHTDLPPANNECKTALGNPKDADGNDINEGVLRVAGNDAGFYACVDSSRTLAQVFIRGNALRRIQKDADYSVSKSAFFPKANFQVQGLSGLGQ